MGALPPLPHGYLCFFFKKICIYTALRYCEGKEVEEGEECGYGNQQELMRKSMW